MPIKKILNTKLKKKELKDLLLWGFKNFRIENVSKLTETLKKLGFLYSTKASISIDLVDLKILNLRNKLIYSKKDYLKKVHSTYKSGFITISERFQIVTETWNSVTNDLQQLILNYFKNYESSNSIFLMTTSGARGTISQISQIIGMRGLMSDQNGNLIELPIINNFKHGLTLTDFLISSYGARKGITDTALKTADAGYLTRKLVEASNYIFIQTFDCETKSGIKLIIKNSNELNLILGRTVARNIKDKRNNTLLLRKNETVTYLSLKSLVKHKAFDIIIRSPLTCNLTRFFCQKCYGWDLSLNQNIKLGQNIGIIAAQSIGEPGLQLTMRTFHSGGILSSIFKKQICLYKSGQFHFLNNKGSQFVKTSQGYYYQFFLKNNPVLIETYNNENIKLILSKDILWFIKNKEFIKEKTIIGEIPVNAKNITKKILQKNIFSMVSGQLYYPCLINKNNLYRILWIFFSENHKLLSSNKVLIKKNRRLFDFRSIFKNDIMVNFYGRIDKIDESNKGIFFSLNDFFLKNSKLFVLNKRNIIVLRLNTLFFFPKIELRSNGIKLNLEIIKSTNKFNHINHYFKLSKNVLPLGVFSKFNNKDYYKIFVLKYKNSNLNIKDWFRYKIYFKGERLNNRFISQLSLGSEKRYIIKLERGNLFKKIINRFNLSHYYISKRKNLLQGNKIPQLIRKEIVFRKIHGQKSETNNYNLIFKNGHFGVKTLFKYSYNFALLNTTFKNKLILQVKNNFLITPNTIIFSLNTWSKTKNKDIFELTRKPLIKNKYNYKINYKNSIIDCFFEEFEMKTIRKNHLIANDLIIPNLQIINSGKIIKNNDSNLLVQKANIFIFNKNTQIKRYHLDFVDKKDNLLILFFSILQSSDIVQGLPKVNKLLELFSLNKSLIPNTSVYLKNSFLTISSNQHALIKKDIIHLFPKNSFNNYNNYEFLEIGKSFSQITLSKNIKFLLKSYFKYYLSKKNFIKSIRISIIRTIFYLLYLVKNVYLDYNVSIASQNFEVLLKQLTKKGKIIFSKNTPFFNNELINIEQLNTINKYLISNHKRIIYYEPYIYGLTRASLLTSSLISQASSRETSRILIKGAIEGKLDFFRGIKENIIIGNSSSLTTFNKVEESILKLNNLKLLKIH